MKQAAAPTTDSARGASPFVAGVIAMTFLDTTWRIVTPVILLTIPGILLDKRLGTKPWVTLLLVAVGFVLAALLVKRQIEAVEKAEAKK